MSDSDISQGSGSKTPRFRSPPYPAIPLEKAIDRLTELYPKSLHHWVPLQVPADAWGYKIKSSGLNATIAALKQFGLMSDQGSSKNRRFRLTESALRVARDPNPDSPARQEALKKAALAPKIHAELWEQFGVPGTTGAMDVTLKSHLMVGRTENGEHPYSESAADDVIDEYQSSITFAGLTHSEGEGYGNEETIEGDSTSDDIPEHFQHPLRVGDMVQREKDGDLKFPEALRVRAIQSHEGEDWVFVEGNESGFLASEAIIVDRPEGSVPPHKPTPTLPLGEEKEIHKGYAREATDVDEGSVTLTLPEKLSAESFEDLQVWFNYILRKHRRRAGLKDEKLTPPETAT